MPQIFLVRKPRGQKPSATPPYWVLEQDRWDDFGFKTQYVLYYYTLSKTGGIDETVVGVVKIIRKGQAPSPDSLIVDDFDSLGRDFCSVGEALDYYERLNALGFEVREAALSALNDVVLHPELVGDFQNERAWKDSVLRSHPNWQDFAALATSLATGDYSAIPATELTFKFHIPGWLDGLEFNFHAPLEAHVPNGFLSESALPERVAVVIGQNGSGKSLLLSRLARVAQGSTKERTQPPLATIGRLEPSSIGFPRIITVSFSPFDSFIVPGTGIDERLQLSKELEQARGRYVFVGLRDLAAEARLEIEQDQTSPASLGLTDRLPNTRLKTLDTLAGEFANALRAARAKGRGSLLKQAWEILVADPSFNDLRDARMGVPPEDEARSRFLHWSTGHKIVTLVMTSIVAYIEPRSLVLIDEPETHLHPPLLAAFMHAVRAILKAESAFAIVATHSPIVVQETIAQHVHVVRREGNSTKISRPRIETFGESVGLISSEVFGLQPGATDFHMVLDVLVDRLQSIESIEQVFLDGSMSQQARGYVMSRLARKKD